MKKLLKALGLMFAALLIVAAVFGLWKREEIARLLAVNSLFAEDRIVANFSNMDRAFLHVEVPRGDGPVSELPRGPEATMPAGYEAWVEARTVTALVALKDGAIRHEAYYQGTTPEDRRISWSVAKSYLSALFGVLLEEGAIASLDDPVTQYVPNLAGTAYEGASIRNVLNMASGVVFNEDYLDPESDINQMGRAIALGQSLDAFTEGLGERFAEPGEIWQYVSIDTHVIGMVIRGATGRPVAELLSEKIIAPLGLEQSPYYLTDGEGVAFVLGGLNQRTRDYARFGQMVLQGGRYGGVQVVPEGWLAASTAATAPKEGGGMGYGFQWWIPPEAEPGEFLAQGIYGQYIYFNTRLGVVIASNAADRGFREAGVSDANIAMFRAIAAAL